MSKHRRTGDYKVAKPAFVQPIDERTPEQKYSDAEARVMKYLEDLVEIGKQSREELSKKLLSSAGSLVYEASWGHGVKEDYAAQIAVEVLSDIASGHTVFEVLSYHAQQFRANAANNRYTRGSSSAFSNAVDGEKAAVESSIAQRFEGRLEMLTEYRAEMELL